MAHAGRVAHECIEGDAYDTAFATPSTVAPGTPPSPLSNCTEANVQIVIGTSRLVEEDKTIIPRIANFSQKSYGEVRRRLSMGDAGTDASNRVMHVAFRNGVVVGWCSSTARWSYDGGHWGALAVDLAAQGMGIASALVRDAERRLLDAGSRSVQIEYRFTVGDPHSERLFAWYEGKLGFDGGPRPERGSSFRCCHKELTEDHFRQVHASIHVPARHAIQGS